jgi:hypothetical protein
MTCALPRSYDAWRLTPPEDGARIHPGPHEHPVTVEAEGVSLEATGFYDGDGVLQTVQIGAQELPPTNVRRALALLGVECPSWDAPLDGDTLAKLSEKAFEYEAEAKAEARGDW